MAVCVSNGTGTVLKFSYHWGADAWSQDSLASTAARVYWFPLQNGEDAAPRFYIEYDRTLAPGYTPQDYELRQYLVKLPANCLTAKQYIFTASGTDILLQSLN